MYNILETVEKEAQLRFESILHDIESGKTTLEAELKKRGISDVS